MKLVEDWALAMWGQMWMPCWVVPQYSQAWRNIQGGFVHRVPALKNLQGLRLEGDSVEHGMRVVEDWC